MQLSKRVFLLLVLLGIGLVAFAQKEYYTSIDGVKGGATLKDALYTLIKDHTKISYGSGSSSTWGAFYSTDRNPSNNQVYDMYSPEVRYFGTKGDAIGGMNIEHSLPKSWWGGDKNYAYCDLHHLNPSDQNANSRKSNYPLAELESVTWDNGVAAVGKATINGSSMNAFEPCDEYKGDFARTYMYMFTCYQNLTYKTTYMNYESSAYPTLKPWAVELLLKWNEQDPVSEKEIARNNAVYAVQGNRNPYIDYPQLAEYVWGDSIDYIFDLDGAVIGGGTVGGDTDDNTGNYIINEPFSTSLGDFTQYCTASDYSWTIKYSSAYITAYVSNTNNAAESWLISPSMDLTAMDSVRVSFDYVTKYNQTDKVAEHNQLLVSDNYNGDVSAATWTIVDFSIVENTTDWTFTSTGEILLPAEFMGKANVTIAFKYTSTTTKAGTWEVKNLLVEGQQSENPGDSDDDDEDLGDDDNNNDGDDDDDENVGNDGNFVSEKFRLVTDATQLSAGDSVIIVYNTFVMGAQNSNYRDRIDGAVIAGDSIISYPANTQILVLEAGSVDGSFAFNAAGLYLAAVSSSKNYLRSIETVTADASWVITIGSGGTAEIVSQGSYTRNKLQYNTNDPRFSCYTGTQKNVLLYAKSPASPVVEGVVGDLDGSGDVDVADVTTLVSMILNQIAPTDSADIDGSGDVDVADITRLVSIILGLEE